MEQGGDRLMWGLIGCAGLVVVGMCVATGVGAYVFFSASKPMVGMAPGPTAPPPVVPQQPMQPQQPFQPANPNPTNPQLPPPPVPAIPLNVTARVDVISGSNPVPVGAICSFAVERHVQSGPPGYWCRAQIRCNSVLLYGAGSSGYFPCTLTASPRGVVGSDGQTTSADTDPSMSISTQTHQLALRDDATGSYGAYDLRATITSTR